MTVPCMWCRKMRRQSTRYIDVCRDCAERMDKRVTVRIVRRKLKKLPCVCGVTAFGIPLDCLIHAMPDLGVDLRQH